MKIDVNGFSPFPKKILNEKNQKSSVASAAKKAAAEDVSELSRGSAASPGKSFGTLKARLQNEINAPASPERLEKLRASIKGGTYHIPTEDLVNAILGQ